MRERWRGRLNRQAGSQSFSLFILHFLSHQQTEIKSKQYWPTLLPKRESGENKYPLYNQVVYAFHLTKLESQAITNTIAWQTRRTDGGVKGQIFKSLPPPSFVHSQRIIIIMSNFLEHLYLLQFLFNVYY